MQVAEKIYKANTVLEAARDRMLGFDTPLAGYTVGEDGNIINSRVRKLTDTILLYILKEDPLLNKDEIRFIKTALLSAFYFASNREALPDCSLTFKMALAAVNIIEEDPESYAELVSTEYFTLRPNFMVANLDGEEIGDGEEFEIEATKLMEIGEDQEEEIRKNWEKEHPNALLADEILTNDQMLFELLDDMPEQLYALTELAVCAFLDDEKKYDWEFFEKISDLENQG